MFNYENNLVETLVHNKKNLMEILNHTHSVFMLDLNSIILSKDLLNVPLKPRSSERSSQAMKNSSKKYRKNNYVSEIQHGLAEKCKKGEQRI